MATRIPVRMVAVAAACVAVLAVLAALWYLPPASSAVHVPPGPTYQGSNVLVTDVDFSPDYWTNNSSQVGYLTTPNCYPTRNPTCPTTGGYIVLPECPAANGCANVTPGAEFLFDLTLIVNASQSHTILSIVMIAPFTFVSSTPTLPHTVKPGLPATTFQLVLQSPDAAGEYDLSGFVNSY